MVLYCTARQIMEEELPREFGTILLFCLHIIILFVHNVLKIIYKFVN